ncbi:MAG: hypothetical protein IKD58_14570, partial [Loktanella sp.]|nr:hypothetical protein [Loktanella sp.]
DLEGQQFGSDATPLFNRIQIWKPVDGGPNNVLPNGAYDYAVGAGGARDKFIINDNNPTTGGFRFDFDAYVLINATYTYIDGTTSNQVVANVVQGAGPSGSQLWIVPPVSAGDALNALTAKPIAFVTFGTVVSDNNNTQSDRPDPDLIDVIDGSSGDDTMGLGFKDSTSYLESPDRQVIDDSGNYIRGFAGNDTITAGAGNDVIYGGSGSDVIRGGAGNDVIYGGDGHDQLFGGDGNDQLFGGAGDDTLDGGSGTNTLTGGTGNDTFVYNAGSTVTITDFNADPNNNINDGDSTTNDRVDLSAY